MGFSYNLKIIREFRKVKSTDLEEDLKISRQKLSNWESGLNEPRTDILNKLAEYLRIPKEVFYMETLTNDYLKKNYSDENPTPVQEGGDNKEMNSNHDQVYRTIVEGHTEYVLIPRSVLSETQLVSTEQINKTWQELAEKNKELERKNKQLDFYQEQFAKLMDNMELAPKPPKAKEV